MSNSHPTELASKIQRWLGWLTVSLGFPFLCGFSLCSQSVAQIESSGPSIQVPNRWESDSLTQPDSNVRNQIGLALWNGQPESMSSVSPTLGESVPSNEQFSTNKIPDSMDLESLTSRENLGSTLQAALILAAISLAPAIVLMTTSYVRVIVVLTLLKQAFGAQQLPPNQVLTALSLFITGLIMMPVWQQVKTDAIDPYTRVEDGISWDEAWERGIKPVKRFMANQILAAKNDEAVALFYRYQASTQNPTTEETTPGTLPTWMGKTSGKPEIQNAPLSILLPAFVISELKVAFLIGFQIYLPFLVLDLVVSSVTVSSGMLMLPPTMVSFPLKLFMFVLVDGWNLVVGMLLHSFHVVT